jgi:hypothetical protein
MTLESIIASVQQKPDFESVLSFLQSQKEADASVKLLECRVLEEKGDLESAEGSYMDILETQTGSGDPYPLGLLHYLAFIARTRSLDESINFLDDLVLAESEHVTPELFPAVALGLVWQSTGLADEARLYLTCEVFRKGLQRLKGQKRLELVVSFASFLALAANQLKLAQLELSGTSTSSPMVWKKWEEILLEFNADLSTVKSMQKMFKRKDGSEAKKDHLVEDVSGVITLSDHPEAAVESWLLNNENENIIKSIMDKFRIGPDMWPPSSVLESVLGEPHRAGLFGEGEVEEVVDGGIEPTNHIYRPDVTQMLKYSPAEDMERKAEIPTAVRNLVALLPERTLKHANTQYMAEQCVRLLVSITMPPRMVTEETYANADKRARAAYEMKYVKQVPTVSAPVVMPKDKQEEEAVSRVKKEQY